MPRKKIFRVVGKMRVLLAFTAVLSVALGDRLWKPTAQGRQAKRLRPPAPKAPRRERSGSADAALFDLVQQRLVADAEVLSCLSTIPVNLPQRLFDRCALGLHRGRLGNCRERSGSFLLSLVLVRTVVVRHGHRRVRGAIAPADADGHRYRGGCRDRDGRRNGDLCRSGLTLHVALDLAYDEVLVLENDDALHHVLELADVSRPIVLKEELPQLV